MLYYYCTLHVTFFDTPKQTSYLSISIFKYVSVLKHELTSSVVCLMTGLVASFNLEIGITGAILTKLDGDSRGGAALSVKEVINYHLPQ